MAAVHSSASATKVAILTIDRIPRPEPYGQPNRQSNPNFHFQQRKRLRPTLLKQACKDEGAEVLSSSLQKELLVRSLCLPSQVQHHFPRDLQLQSGSYPQNVPREMRANWHSQCEEVHQSQHGSLKKARMKPLLPVHSYSQTRHWHTCQGMLPERIQANPALHGLTMLQQHLFGEPFIYILGSRTAETPHYTSLASLSGPHM
ncbi:hypothetical protein XENTR_v10012223 [Xenopus tropicalis]|uniref:Uncharacterized protein LOC105948227 n=1 Tax=Xenopus tropicalis TaxID=8364 RepID=A0A8J1JG65_XENTR|nr:uncharacterized protein LOC105948227 [Xenopus tropicalis]KAE8610729.1 hypothetical protein XENTR_v10012223 [Xenopus tropicalis]